MITCSALRRSYRDRLRGNGIVFIHLAGSRDQITQRLATRLDHFMPASLLESQIAALEPPAADENVITIQPGGTPTEVA
ncbi:MAG: gluconokinase, partial [Pseudonocardia sp.]|nr:gluconokinase [Pseudonocardia sp.]